MNLVIKVAAIALPGPLSHFVSLAKSGNRMMPSFCAACGPPAISGAEPHPEFVTLRAGTLDTSAPAAASRATG